MESNEEKPKKTGYRGPEHLANRKGRIPGSVNKNTQLVREAYQRLTEDNLANMSIWLSQIAADNPEKAFKLMLEMSEYVLPKLNRTEITGAGGEDLFKNVKFEFGPSVSERMIDLDAEDTDFEETN
jgi:hypothetical protein